MALVRTEGGIMKFSFTTMNSSVLYGFEPAIPDQIAAAAGAGYDFVSLDIWSLLAHEEAGTSLGDVVRRLEAESVGCFELMALMMSESSTQARENLHTILRLAEELQPAFVIIATSEPVARGWVDNLATGINILKERGFQPAIEFNPYSPLRSIKDAVGVCEELASDDLKIVVDCWHFFRGSSTWEDLENLPLGRIAYIHFDDAERLGNEDLAENSRHRRCLPGEGEFDLDRFCDCIVRKGFDGTISVEILSRKWRARPYTEFAAASLSATRKYWPAARLGGSRRTSDCRRSDQ